VSRLYAVVALMGFLGVPVKGHTEAMAPQAERERKPQDALERRPKDALERLSRQIATEVSGRGVEPPMALWIQGESPELERAFSSILAAELSAQGLAAQPLTAASAEAAEKAARQTGARTLLRVSLSLWHGLLQARGDVLGTWSNFWSGQTPSRPATPAFAIAMSTDADAQTLALAAQPPLELPPVASSALEKWVLQGTALTHLLLPTAALTAADLDGDGVDEVLVLTDDELIAFSPDGKVLARRDHRALPPSATPCREPVGSIAVYSNPPRVAYLSARRARGEVLEFDKESRAFKPMGTLDQAPLGAGTWVMSASLLPGQAAFAPEVTVVGKGVISMGSPFVTLSAVPSAGGGEAVVIFANGTGARLSIQTSSLSGEPLSSLGAGTALVDLDGDNRPELVTSSPSFAPDPDEVRVLDNAGKTILWQSPVRGRILQVAGVTLERGKPPGIAVGVWLPDGTSEVQLYRRISP